MPPRREQRARTTNPSARNAQMGQPDNVMVQILQNLVALQQSQNTGDPVFKQFNEANPPSFDGTPDTAMAEKWIARMEKIFKRVNCSDQQKVSFATYKLEGEADHWWKTIEHMQPAGGAPMTWDHFVEHFNQKYFPESVRDQKEMEFLTLKQGDMTVCQYEAKFAELSRYAGDLVNTEQKRAKRFMKGLKDEIRVPLAANRLNTYAETLSRALNVEGELNVGQPRSAEKRVRPSEPQAEQSMNKQVKRGNFQQNRNDAKQQGKGEWCNRCMKQHPEKNCPRKTRACFICGKQGHLAAACRSQRQEQGQGQAGVQCSRCGRPHVEKDCPWHNRACFECGQQGHRAYSCPNKGKNTLQTIQAQSSGQPNVDGQNRGGHQKPKTQARVFALTQQDAQTSNEVVTAFY